MPILTGSDGRPYNKSWPQKKAASKQEAKKPPETSGFLRFWKVPEVAAETIEQRAGQLGLFDAPSGNNDRAQGYLSDMDKAFVDPATGQADQYHPYHPAKPEHDSIVLLTARAKESGRYLYKLYSNVQELSFSNKWVAAIHSAMN